MTSGRDSKAQVKIGHGDELAAAGCSERPAGRDEAPPTEIGANKREVVADLKSL